MCVYMDTPQGSPWNRIRESGRATTTSKPDDYIPKCTGNLNPSCGMTWMTFRVNRGVFSEGLHFTEEWRELKRAPFSFPFEVWQLKNSVGFKSNPCPVNELAELNSNWLQVWNFQNGKAAKERETTGCLNMPEIKSGQVRQAEPSPSHPKEEVNVWTSTDIHLLSTHIPNRNLYWLCSESSEVRIMHRRVK